MSRLLEPEGLHALEIAATVADPDSLAAAQQVRAVVDADLAAQVLTQESLRRRSVAKVGERGRSMLWTRDGLEQATRPLVSAWRAERLVAAGITRIVDLGCGVGADAIAFAEAGVEVVAVEKDEQTAAFAALNLAPYPQADVVVGDVVDLVDFHTPPSPGTAVFLDPARRVSGRAGSRRSWEVADLSPPWEFVQKLLARDQLVVVKLGPGFPDRLLPDDAETVFVADGADLVEASVWHGGGFSQRRGAVVLREGEPRWELFGSDRQIATDPRIGGYLLEPASAVIRAHLAADLPGAEQWWAPFDQVAYLCADQPVCSPVVTCFEVLEQFKWSEKALRQWCRQHQIGTLEIKKRGVELDPAQLRTRLKLSGSSSATVVIAPHVDGAICLVVRRVVQPQ